MAIVGFFGIDTRGAAPFHIELSNEDVSTDFGLFPHQRKTALCVGQRLEGANDRVILHMPAGAGKIRTAIYIVSHFLNSVEPSLVVWLAATAELLEQAADAFKAALSHLGNREVSLVRFRGQYDGDFNASSDGIVIGGLQKFQAFSQREPIGLLRFALKVKLIIIDEAHQASRTRNRAAMLINLLRPVRAHPEDIDDVYGEDEGGGSCAIYHK